MRARVLMEFRDRRDWAVAYAAGDIVDVDEARMAELVGLGLVEDADAAAPAGETPAVEAADAPPRPRPKGRGKA